MEKNCKFIKIIIVTLLVIILPFSGCINTDPIDRAVNVIDRGISDIETGSADWQSVIQRVAKDLPNDISATIRNDAQNLATRSIAAAGAEARCNADFLKDRAIQSLKNLKAKLLGQTPTLLPPIFCQVVPPNIDLKDPPSKWPIVTYFGYDLDKKDSNGNLFNVLMLDNQGTSTPLSENLIGRTTHYQVTLNLGNLGKTLYEKNIQKLIFKWGSSNYAQGDVVIIPWQPKIDTSPKIVPLTTGPYIPPLTRGDRDFDSSDSNYMSVIVRGYLQFTPQSISTRVYMYGHERESDYTTVEGYSPWSVAYSAPKGWKIIDVNHRTLSNWNGNIIDHGEKQFSPITGDVVKYFLVRGDRDDDEAGIWTGVTVYWNQLDITLQETSPSWLN